MSCVCLYLLLGRVYIWFNVPTRVASDILADFVDMVHFLLFFTEKVRFYWKKNIWCTCLCQMSVTLTAHALKMYVTTALRSGKELVFWRFLFFWKFRKYWKKSKNSRVFLNRSLAAILYACKMRSQTGKQCNTVVWDVKDDLDATHATVAQILDFSFFKYIWLCSHSCWPHEKFGILTNSYHVYVRSA